MKLLKYLDKQSRLSLIVLGFVFIVLLGGCDYLTGPELSFSIFYLVPVSLVTWLGGRRAGILTSIMGATSWLTADLLATHSYSHPAIPYWNATVRLGFFLIVTYALSALRASKERQEELGQFIVHDLRSPLANVMTGLAILQEIAGEKMDADQKDVVDTCIMSCNWMLTLINSLLDLARLESGQMPLQLCKVNIENLIESSLKQVAVWAEQKRVTLTSYLNRGVETVYTDPEVAMRILVNLLSNAIKFSQSESVVAVYVAPSDANMVTFSVTDRGPGISKEWVDKVFDKFVQVKARKAGSAVGSGLGLTFCRLAIEAQGGRIWVDSEIDKGTTVAFALPMSAR